MRARVNIETDPISLVIIAADGAEHAALDAANGTIVEVALVIKAEPDEQSALPCSPNDQTEATDERDRRNNA